jgi:hypothetical protein
MTVNEISMEVTVSFLHPHGQSPSYVYTQQIGILSISFSEVLSKVDPRTVTGRTHTFASVETQLTIEKLRHTRNY